MSVGEWTAIGGLVIGLLGAIYASMKVIVRSIMTELSHNNGSSIKDQVSRIEERLNQLILELAIKNK